MHSRDWFLVFVSIFLPPIAVGLKRGFLTKDTLLNVLLFVLGYFPGLIHALYVISKHPYPSGHGDSLTRPNDGYGSLS
ncbi:LANO_0G00716g1_1 [Lachancea nothofagi CBS 11611]|uniref:LANO_0G00716g1_1 n=1 Tax=Lachancea nothofagi CBS 11611 TaxID=1266666 RepID=A0A1G4KEH1_9SACH|nr:LANO_0G00716g1_1 [Lachancea nothofagi CBS 11611]